MKNLFNSFFLFCCLGALSSCGGAPEMHTAEGGQRVIDIYNQHIDTEHYRPTTIRYREYDKLSNRLGYVTFTMIGKSDNKTYTLQVDIDGNNDSAGEIERSNSSDMMDRFSHLMPNRKAPDFETAHWISPSEIDPALIAKQMESAFSQVPNGHTVQSIEYVALTKDNDAGVLKCSFGVNVTEDGRSTSQRGKLIVTTYTTIRFDGQPDGTAKINE